MPEDDAGNVSQADGLRYAIDVNEKYLRRMESLLFQNSRLRSAIGEAIGVLRSYSLMAANDQELSDGDEQLLDGLIGRLAAIVEQPN